MLSILMGLLRFKIFFYLILILFYLCLSGLSTCLCMHEKVFGSLEWVTVSTV